MISKKIKKWDKEKFGSPKELEKVNKEYDECSEEAKKMFKEKNTKHWKNFFLKRGIPGIIVRMEDKIHDVEMEGKYDEEVSECFLDIVNYAIMGAIVAKRTKIKPKENASKKTKSA